MHRSLTILAVGILAFTSGCRMFGTVNSSVEVRVFDEETPQQPMTFEATAYDAKSAAVKAKYKGSLTFDSPGIVDTVDFVLIEAVGYESQRVNPGAGEWHYSAGHGGVMRSHYKRNASASLKRLPPPTREAIPDIVKHLTSGTDGQKIATLRLLQRTDLKPEEAVPALRVAMNTREDTNTRGMHVLARDELLRIKGKEWVTAQLLESVKNSSDVYQREYLYSISKVIALDDDGSTARLIVDRVLPASHTTDQNKSYVLQLFSKSAPPDADAMLAQLRKLNAVPVRINGQKVLIDYNAEGAKRSAIVQLGASRSLSDSAVEAILKATENGDAEVLISTAEALGKHRRVNAAIVQKLIARLMSLSEGDSLFILGRPTVAAFSKLGPLAAFATEIEPAIPRLLDFCTKDRNGGYPVHNFGRDALEAIGSPAARVALERCASALGPVDFFARPPTISVSRATNAEAAPKLEMRRASTFPLPGYQEVRQENQPFSHDQRIYLSSNSELTTDDFESAQLSMIESDILQMPEVRLKLTETGARKLRSLTAQTIGGRIAILLDATPVSVYVVAEPFERSRVIRISAGLTTETAERLKSAFER